MAIISVDEEEVLGWSRDAETWLDNDHLILLRGWAADGYTYVDIAKKIGIDRHTLRGWRKKYPAIDQAMSKGREMIDYKVENALLHSALGGMKKEVKTTTIIRHGKLVETQKEVLETEREPVQKAIEFWLTNRLPDKWKRNPGESLEDKLGDGSIHIEVVRATDKSENEKSASSGSSSTSFKPTSEEEVDEDWVETMSTENKNIKMRRSTEAEKKAARLKQKQSKPKKRSTFVEIEPEDNVDYWPDNWEELVNEDS